MDSFSERLAWSREKAGYSSPREAARSLEWNENTYKSHENGIRGGKDAPPQDTVRTYARAFGVDFLWLLTGEGSPTKRNVARVFGRIGAGAEILPDHEQVPPGGLFEIEAPFTVAPDAIAFEVEGESMWPRYDPGDVIICWRAGANLDDLIGFEAAVQTDDGKRFLKRVLVGREPGTFDLESHNAQPIRGVRLVWSARIAATIRAGEWRLIESKKMAGKLRRTLAAARA